MTGNCFRERLKLRSSLGHRPGGLAIWPCFVAFTAMMVVPLWARSDGIPNLDVRPVCRGIASQAADPLVAGLKATFEECLKSEQAVREQLKREWPNFSAADKQHCVALATTGGESSNTELLTCLEMARDVRAARASAHRPKQAASSASRRPDPTTGKASPDSVGGGNVAQSLGRSEEAIWSVRFGG